MVRLRQKSVWAFFALGLIFSFQNCSKGYQSKSAESLSTSAQCAAQMRTEAPSYNLSATDLQCGDFNQYACERRIFSPDTVDLTESLKECLPDSDICVDVEVRHFNTSAAQATAPASAFAPGGDYNHEEIQCYHRMVYRGVALFQSTADSLEQALANAMAACEQAVTK